MIKAEAGIERATKYQRRRGSKYPWETMEIGESFVCEAKCESGSYNVAKAASFRYSPKKFEGGLDTNGIQRVWRVA